MKTIKFFLVLFLVSMLAFSCSSKKSTDNSVTEEPPQEVTIDPVTVPEALQTSSDPHAQQVVGYVQMINMFQSFVQNLIPQQHVGKVFESEGTLDGPPWVYTWTNGPMSFTLTITIEDDQYHWKLVLNGADPSTGQTYNKFVFMEAWQKLDGSSGKLVINEFGEGGKVEWNWNIDKDGTEKITYIDYMSNTKIEVVQNKDLSGSIQVWENNVLVYKAVWNADGSGTWWVYDEEGNVSSGTWS